MGDRGGSGGEFAARTWSARRKLLAEGKLLPVIMPNRKEFPFRYPTVFRSRNNNGRYIVHKVVPKEEECECREP